MCFVSGINIKMSTHSILNVNFEFDGKMMEGPLFFITHDPLMPFISVCDIFTKHEKHLYLAQKRTESNLETEINLLIC